MVLTLGGGGRTNAGLAWEKVPLTRGFAYEDSDDDERKRDAHSAPLLHPAPQPHSPAHQQQCPTRRHARVRRRAVPRARRPFRRALRVAVLHQLHRGACACSLGDPRPPPVKRHACVTAACLRSLVSARALPLAASGVERLCAADIMPRHPSGGLARRGGRLRSRAVPGALRDAGDLVILRRVDPERVRLGAESAGPDARGGVE